MKQIKRRYYIITAVICLIVAVALWGYYYLFSVFSKTGTVSYINIDADDTADSVCQKLTDVASPHALNAFRMLASYYDYDQHIRTGHYALSPASTTLETFRQLRNGLQEPIKLTVPEVRTLDRMAAVLAPHLMIDSTAIANALQDTLLCQRLGYDSCTVVALFIPNTYEVYWNISAEALLERMKKENDAFWNAQGRKEKADALGLTPIEVATLASIVDEETAANAEKPTIAGLYLNRLRQGMLLQADPTVKFALGDFTLRRILNRHLEVDNPYNTYRYAGLPPGPIRVPSVVGIDAVLNYQQHDYLYMCAKEDFSGTHNFARTLQEHQRNATRYAAALNQRGIK